ncbi:MAG: nuclear transport factor 2 family protein [Bacteroidota bacterium]
MKTNKSILFIVGTLTFLACSNNVKVKSKEALKKEIEFAMEHYIYAINSLNVDSVVDCWAVNSKFISANNDIDGKEELIDFLAPRYKDVTFVKLEANTLKLDVSDSLAVQLSEYSQTFSIGGGPKTSVTGRQITVWRKENETWKISLVNTIPSPSDTIH